MDLDQNHTTWILCLYVCPHNPSLGIVRSNQGFGLYYITSNISYSECVLHAFTTLVREMDLNQ